MIEKKFRPKNPIKFKIQLNQEQKEAKKQILLKDVSILSGKWGSGKTLLATQCALDLLFRKEVSRIIISRPTVSEEEIGFLKGGLMEKMQPWIRPIYDNMYQLYDKEKIDKCISDGSIEVIPFAFMRGITFTDAFVIIDEVQNVSHTQLGMVMSRLGKNSKMVLTGDPKQTDLRGSSSIGTLIRIAQDLEEVVHINLKTNHRSPIVEKIVEYF